MKSERIGAFRLLGPPEERFRAYIPPPLPPKPPIDMRRLHLLLDRANQAIGRLDGITSILPDPALFLYTYVRKEAVLSSQIEGTQSSLSDLLLYENEAAPGVPTDDISEVSRYVAAMDYGLKRLRGGFPLSLRLIRDIHARLMAKGRGQNQSPGEFRRSQNWIGGTRPGNAAYVPPPVEEMKECLHAFEKFLHADHKLPVLVRAALMHVQFETIHPFLDGNGRLGRLLITFLLCVEDVLRQPTLYLSLYLKTHRSRYYELLQRVRTHGDWESWTEFFLEGVEVSANQAVEAARRSLDLFERDRRKIEQKGRASASMLRMHALLQRQPLISLPRAARLLKLSMPTVTLAAAGLAGLKIVQEVTGKRRGRLYSYHRYLEILGEGTEPLTSRAAS